MKIMTMLKMVLTWCFLFVGCDRSSHPIIPGLPPLATSPTVPAPGLEKDLLICAGQSNMQGVGTQHYYSEDPLIKGMNNRQGPCFSAAMVLAHTPTARQITIINCAVGGSKIASWQRGSQNYQKCLSDITQSQTVPPMKIMGLLFYQGESDASPGMVTWPQDFTQVMRAFQSDLNAPSLPIVYAQIGAYCDIPGMVCEDATKQAWADFQDLQVQAQAPGIRMIQTKDLPTWDGVHHTDDTYLVIGRRFANQLQ